MSLDWLITNHNSCGVRRSKHYILLNGEAFVTFRKVSAVSSVIIAETQCIWLRQGIRFLPGWTHPQPVSQGRGLTFLKMTDDVEYLSWHFKETWCLEAVGHPSLEKISYFRFPRGRKNEQVTGFWNTCCFSCAWGLICSLINKLCAVTSVEKKKTTYLVNTCLSPGIILLIICVFGQQGVIVLDAMETQRGASPINVRRE